MSFYYCLISALIHIRRYFFVAIKLVFAMVLCTILFVTYSAYQNAVNLKIADISAMHASMCYVQVDTNAIQDIMQNHSEMIAQYKLVAQTISCDIDSVEMRYHDKTFVGVNDFSFDFIFAYHPTEDKSWYRVPFSIGAYDANSTYITENELNEFGAKYKKDKYIIGRMPKQAGEVAVSNYMLNQFFRDEEKIDIGHKISFRTVNEKAEILRDFTLVGIIDSDIFRVEGNKTLPQVVVAADNNINGTQAPVLRLYPKGFSEATALLNRLNNENIAYSAPDIIHVYTQVEIQQKIALSIFGAVSVLICIIIFLELLTTLYFNIVKTLKTTYMHMAIGMSSTALSVTHGLVFLLYGMTSAVLSTVLVALVFYTYNETMAYTLGVVIDMGLLDILALELLCHGVIFIFLVTLRKLLVSLLTRKGIAQILSSDAQ